MEGLTRLVSESLARHGFDRPLDYRRLCWSRWFRCDSHHSLLFVPSKPGVFAIAEEIIDFSPGNTHAGKAYVGTGYVGTAAPGCPAERSSADLVWDRVSDPVRPSEARLNVAAATPAPRRLLAVTQFFEDDDMAFVLDRMMSRPNPMNARLASGRYFARFVVIEDQTQRRSICNALNQWMVSAAEKATGIGSHFASSLELTPSTEYIPAAHDAQPSLFVDTRDTHVAADAFVRPPAPSAAESVWDRVSDPVGPSAARQDFAGMTDTRVATGASPVPRSEASGSGVPLPPSSPTAPHLDSGAATNIHCPSPFPSGF
jgi:hypothetical protein